jgi:glycerophosphoryl diester phosphodiesterase
MLYALLGSAVAAPIVIAHRGLPATYPDHTLAGYEAAIDAGADFVEPDLVPTKDGQLVCRHENDLSETTDVREKFPERHASKVVDGKAISGWFTEDFTLAELKTLRAKQPLAFRPHDRDGQYEIPTFVELLDLVARKEKETGRRIGIYPETKHPTYFDKLELSLEEPLVRLLNERGYHGPEDPVFVQSFETDNLKELRKLTKVRLIRLVDDAGDLLSPKGLADIATYADGIGVHKSHLVAEATGFPNDVLEHAHTAGLLVHVYTFRDEASYLPAWAGGDAQVELKKFYELGVDGVFSDNSASALTAR